MKRIAAALALTLSLTACGANSDPLAEETKAGSSAVTVGSANFAESELLGEIYSQALEAKGVTVTRKFNIGAREAYLKALQDGSISLLPEYNGALLAALTPGGAPEGVSSSDDVLAALKKVLPAGTEVLDQSAAQDKDTLTVTAETATKNNLKTIEDLKAVAGQFVVGAGPEFAERHQGLKGLESVYGLKFKEFKPLDAGGPLTVTALKDGDIDVANIFSTDSSIVTNKFVVLEDPKNLYLAQNILPLIRTEANNATVSGALNAVSAKLTTENLTSYLAQVQVDKKDTKTVAKAFLTENGLA
ncbi:glycine/betaine ABC transporter substrate-binding protein [Actinoplanes lobatus]|uniref:Glycine/betaine ABC transporter substrate-binding protein n=1 Tax=Actinoplanes lobatus TaxID=113568 RepID=A0A7W7MKZ6_9ACTN|nr:ABC transporter substrate-binding protein [Actinoplanes lobatus]MBB4754277.1 osmoprotectant transport system substrate-binding protein [Actinoplanes lobatus]GGN62253.1 glycine/betaine ABC transporter substrate-binding protein [Actinoplanes lobatus]GIE46057.1 glycine/betaine ABC transporter substrate-binding protein [Actinoplanes lobatus]